MRRRRTLWLWSLLLLTGVACGGGGDGSVDRAQGHTADGPAAPAAAGSGAVDCFPVPAGPGPHDRPGNIRQILGRPGEVWGAESAADALVRLRT